MTGLKEALGRMQSQYALIPSNNKADYTMQVMAGDYDTIRAALAEQEAEIARWKGNAATQQASAESCMRQALENGSAALTAEAALNDAVGLLRRYYRGEDVINQSLWNDARAFLAQHPPRADAAIAATGKGDG